MKKLFCMVMVCTVFATGVFLLNGQAIQVAGDEDSPIIFGDIQMLDGIEIAGEEDSPIIFGWVQSENGIEIAGDEDSPIIFG